MPTLSVKRGSQGFVVRLLQQLLNRAISKDVLTVDSKFGDVTKDKVVTFQQLKYLPPTGEADELTWQKLGYAWPHPFYRSLSLTMAFEGTGFGGVCGNFDGCILTFGALGFNIKYGSAQRVLRMYRNAAPDRFAYDFGAVLSKALDDNPPNSYWTKLLLTNGQPKAEVKYWFAEAGKDERMVREQLLDAWEKVWTPAKQKCLEVLNIKSDRGIACVFDTFVNNGSIKPASEKRILKLLDKPEEDRIRQVCIEAAKTCNPRWREHVLGRKSVYVQPEAVANKTKFQVDWYGFDTPPAGFVLADYVV